MKIKLIVLFVLVYIFAFSSIASADTWVNGYFRKDGTYVSGHYRSNPDGNPWNNYSTYGNINPYTGEKGYIIPYYNDYNYYNYNYEYTSGGYYYYNY